MNSQYKFYLYKIISTPPNKLTSKLIKLIKAKLEGLIQKSLDLRRDTHVREVNISKLYSYIDINMLDISEFDESVAEFLCSSYLTHNFDLLGSGWTNVDYPIDPLGVDGYKYQMSPKVTGFFGSKNWLDKILLKPHLNEAIEIFKNVDNEYTPIDWQCDFKSGYRWDARKWYKELSAGEKIGADIKVPWELGRLQHLPQMAILSLILPEYKERLINEFKNQTLDFIATNPPRMGVNWTCTMDVSIRAANMLLSYELFKQQDANGILNDRFMSAFIKSIYEHGIHIVNNFEWSEILTSNHYLANVCGLLFISAYLERNELTDAWLVFSVQEIISEMNKQFNNDGTNFEASTSYHRLSSEMMIYCSALVYGVLKSDKINAFKLYNTKKIKRLISADKQKYDLMSNEFFPNEFIQKLYKAGCFTVDISKPDGNIVQIGDNDSGRFFRLSSVGEFISIQQVTRKYWNLKYYTNNNNNRFWDENILNHATLVSAINGLFPSNKFDRLAQGFPLEKSIIKSMSKNKTLTYPHFRGCKNFQKEVNSISLLEYSKTSIIDLKLNDNESALSNIQQIVYPDFGVYIFKSDFVFLCIMAGGNGQNGNAGHTHNDKLSFELNVKGKDFYVDPGTFVYTALPEKRNEFRSVHAHNTIIVDNQEQNEYLTLFSMKDETRCNILDIKNDYIKLYLNYRDIHHVREFKIFHDKIQICDYCNKSFIVNFNDGKRYSNGYGKLIDCMEV